MTSQLTLDFATRAGDRAMRAAARSAEKTRPQFTLRAAEFMLAHLTINGPCAGEDLTLAAKAAGYTPKDDRAFGAAFKVLTLIGAKVIDYCPRKRGHGSAGGKVYAV